MWLASAHSLLQIRPSRSTLPVALSLSLPWSIMSTDAPALPHSSPSLMRLALVERQLVMQMLDYTALARIMCTCRQLSAESLHPQSGKFIQSQTNFPLNISEALDLRHPFQPHEMHASPLFCAHMPMNICLITLDADIPDLIVRLTRFKRIRELDLWDAGWPEEQALHFVESPVVQSVKQVWGLRPGLVWLDSKAVQRAIFALPLLHKISCYLFHDCTVVLDSDALANARMLREAVIDMPVNHYRVLAPLAAAPQLRDLKLLLDRGRISPDDPSPIAYIPSLASLSLSVRSRDAYPNVLTMCALLAGFPQLIFLQVEDFGDPEIVLRSCLSIGAVQLPALRSCRSPRSRTCVGGASASLPCGVSACGANANSLQWTCG